METQVSNQLSQTVKLDDEAQSKVVAFVLDIDKKGRAERYKYEKGPQGWEQCENAYHTTPWEQLSKENAWQSNLVLPWAYDAVESWYAYLHGSLIPTNDKIFTVSGHYKDDDPGAKTMEQYLEYRFNRNKFPEQMGKALKMAAIRNHACVKVYWKDDSRTSYEWQDEPIMDTSTDPATGQPLQIQTGTNKVRKPVNTQIYNNVWFDVIDIDDVAFHPIHGDFDKTNFVHTTSMFLEELQEQVDSGQANYFNIDKVVAENEKADDNPSPEHKSDGVTPKTGLTIKECWISRIKIDDKVYNNYVATIVNDKTLIRFQPNPNDYGKKPFVWFCVNPDANCLYGYGLLSHSMPILKSASFIFNQRLNEIKLKLYGSYKYYDDGVFNPYEIISQPGAMIPMADSASAQGNLVPLNPALDSIQLGYQEVAEHKVEYEEITVPKIVKGMVEQSDTTATEINHAQANSSGKMNIVAYHINEDLLKPLLEWSYLLTYQRMQFDDDLKYEIARTTIDPLMPAQIPPGVQPPPGPPLMVEKSREQMIAELPKFIPFPDVDIDMVGYRNFTMKQQQGAAMAIILPQLAQSPGEKYLKWYDISQQAFNTAELDPDRFMVNEEQAQQIDQQAQQKQPDPNLQLKMEIEQLSAQVQIQLAQERSQTDSMKAQLQALEIHLKYGIDAQRLQNEKIQTHNDAVLGVSDMVRQHSKDAAAHQLAHKVQDAQESQAAEAMKQSKESPKDNE